jgi:AcrR family transcriptional regulator
MRKNISNDEFMDALTDLLLAEGIKSLTVGEIAACLHCSRRRLYDIAQTKEEIFCAAAEHFFNRVLSQSESLIGSEQDLTAALAAYLNVGVQAASRIGPQFLKDVESSTTARGIFDRYQKARTVRLSQLIDEGVRQGVFAPCHGLVVSELILGAALRLRRPDFLAQVDLTLEEAFQEFYRVLLGGLLIDKSNGKSKR